MKNRIWVVLLVISLGINIGFLLHWLWPHFAPVRAAGISAGWHSGPMKRHLGLDSGQSQQMEGERRQVLDQARPLQDALRQKRRELLVLLKGEDARETDIDPLLGEIARLQAAIEKLFIMHSLKVRSVFSPAQLRKYDGFLERGLCPGMMPGQDCASPAGTGGGLQRSDCGSAAETKK